MPLASASLINAQQGWIELNVRSTANGVGIKTYSNAGAALDLSTTHRAGEFTPGASSYQIHIGAQYFRLPGYTIGDVQFGTANAELSFFIEYR